MDFATTVKELRRKCLLSQMDFAKEIGVSLSTVNRWETGKTVPNFKTMKRIQSFCKCNNIEFDFAGDAWEARE